MDTKSEDAENKNMLECIDRFIVEINTIYEYEQWPKLEYNKYQNDMEAAGNKYSDVSSAMEDAFEAYCKVIDDSGVSRACPEVKALHKKYNKNTNYN